MGTHPAIGLSELRVERHGELVTYALGSCIAVCLHDPVALVGGLLHFVLPQSSIDRTRADRTPDMFADLGIPRLWEAAQRAGATRAATSVRLVGGAATPDGPSGFEIGKRNALAAKKSLWALGLRLVAEETGGSISRTVRLDVPTGAVTITSPGLPTCTL